MRRAFAGDDVGYAEALLQTTLEIQKTMRAPSSHGAELNRNLADWRKAAYSSRRNGEADMRLVFRDRPPQGVEILVFAQRRSIGDDGSHSSAYKVADFRTAPNP